MSIRLGKKRNSFHKPHAYHGRTWYSLNGWTSYLVPLNPTVSHLSTRPCAPRRPSVFRYFGGLPWLDCTGKPQHRTLSSLPQHQRRSQLSVSLVVQKAGFTFSCQNVPIISYHLVIFDPCSFWFKKHSLPSKLSSFVFRKSHSKKKKKIKQFVKRKLFIILSFHGFGAQWHALSQRRSERSLPLRSKASRGQWSSHSASAAPATKQHLKQAKNWA